MRMRAGWLAAWLLDHGADVNRRGPEDRTPLDFADGARHPGWSLLRAANVR
jgi:hypothetical protein